MYCIVVIFAGTNLCEKGRNLGFQILHGLIFCEWLRMAHTHITRTAYNIMVLILVNVSRHATIVKINPLPKN